MYGQLNVLLYLCFGSSNLILFIKQSQNHYLTSKDIYPSNRENVKYMLISVPDSGRVEHFEEPSLWDYRSWSSPSWAVRGRSWVGWMEWGSSPILSWNCLWTAAPLFDLMLSILTKTHKSIYCVNFTSSTWHCKNNLILVYNHTFVLDTFILNKDG